MSVAVTLAVAVTTVETLATNVPAASATKKSVTHDGFNLAKTMNGSSTPPATECAYFEQLLTAGAASINLAALTGTNGRTVNLTGLKVQVFKVKAKATNANPITLTEGAANGYELLGNAWTVVLQPGQEFCFYGNDATPDVAAGARTIDLAGTGTQGVDVAVVAG